MKYLIPILSLVVFTACMGDKKPKIDIIKEVNTSKPIESGFSLEQIHLQNALDKYLAQLKSLNADNIFSMTYPRLFIPINRDKFKNFLNKMLISPDIHINSFDTTISKINTIKPFSEGRYAQIDYKSTITIEFINPELYNSQRKLLILDKILSKKYGRGNIRVDSLNRTITIKKEEKLLAIKENANEWKFLGDNQEYRRLYPKILPIDILNNI